MLLPILVGLDGTQKMSKSLGNYVGISEAPAEMFGKLMSLPDEAMNTYYTLCTDVPLQEVEALLAGHPMDAKKRLGREIVSVYHGAQAAQEAQEAFEKQFSRGEVPEDMPEVQLSDAPLSVTELLKTCFDITGAEAKRMVAQGAVTIDGERADDPTTKVTPQDGMTIKMGKRRWAKVKI